MLKKLLSSFWIRTVLPLALLPLVAFAAFMYPELEAYQYLGAKYPDLLETKPMPVFLEETVPGFLKIFSSESLPHTVFTILTTLILGILWHRSRGERRFGYYVLMFLLAVALYGGARWYAWSLNPPPAKNIAPATPGILLFWRVFLWGAWAFAMYKLVVWDRRTRKIQ